MTAFVRSILGKRNPRNVPLDLYDPGVAAPRRGLAAEQEAFDRRESAREQYADIVREIVRSIDETAYRIDSSRRLEGPSDANGWAKLGQDLAKMFRDAAAAVFVLEVVDNRFYDPKQAEEIQIGGKSHKRMKGERFRDLFEERVVLIEQWILALAAFEARADTQAWRAFRSDDIRSKSQTAIRNVRSLAAHAQASLLAGGGFRKVGQIEAVKKLCSAVADTLAILASKGLVDAAKDPLRPSLADLRADVRKAQQKAQKGEPMPRNLAREAAIREGDELKRNPFAGFRNFRACVRDKSKDPRNYSPAGLCATIERKAHRNPVALTRFAGTLLAR